MAEPVTADQLQESAPVPDSLTPHGTGVTPQHTRVAEGGETPDPRSEA